MTPAVVAFDLETTGLDPESDRIVEFCFMVLDEHFQEQSRWSERVDPGVPIPPESTAVHGIHDEDVRGVPSFAAHAARVQALVDGAILMAYNHGFDLNTLHYELVRHGQKGLRMDHPVIDPFAIFRAHFPHSLEGAVRHYLGDEMSDAHQAEADTLAMVEVFRAQRERHGLPADPQGNIVQGDRRFLDRARRFYEDSDGTVRFGFGKYRHLPVAEHVDYMQWMLGRDFPEDTKNVAARLVDLFMEQAPSAAARRPAPEGGQESDLDVSEATVSGPRQASL